MLCTVQMGQVILGQTAKQAAWSCSCKYSALTCPRSAHSGSQQRPLGHGHALPNLNRMVKACMCLLHMRKDYSLSLELRKRIFRSLTTLNPEFCADCRKLSASDRGICLVMAWLCRLARPNPTFHAFMSYTDTYFRSSGCPMTHTWGFSGGMSITEMETSQIPRVLSIYSSGAMLNDTILVQSDIKQQCLHPANAYNKAWSPVVQALEVELNAGQVLQIAVCLRSAECAERTHEAPSGNYP